VQEIDFLLADGALDMALGGGATEGAQITLQESCAIPGARVALELGDEVGVSLAPLGRFFPGARDVLVANQE
jgi:hypothetical protein